MNKFNNLDVDGIAKFEGKYFALYGWNGEAYMKCFETDEQGYPIKDGADECLKPIYKDIENDDFRIIGYERV